MQATEIDQIRRELETLRDQIQAQRSSNRRAWQVAAAAVALGGLCAVWQAAPEARAQASGILTLRSLNQRLMVVEAKTAPISVSDESFVITGVNVSIVDGSGSTASESGLGNLIVGYNEGNGEELRTGTHNLIVGDFHSYSSYGGLIVGEENAISAPYASVCGGAVNSASGESATVSGGIANLASGEFASVSGGIGNTASGSSASVSGGNTRSAVATNSWTGGSYSSPN